MLCLHRQDCYENQLKQFILQHIFSDIAQARYCASTVTQLERSQEMSAPIKHSCKWTVLQTAKCCANVKTYEMCACNTNRTSSPFPNRPSFPALHASSCERKAQDRSLRIAGGLFTQPVTTPQMLLPHLSPAEQFLIRKKIGATTDKVAAPNHLKMWMLPIQRRYFFHYQNKLTAFQICTRDVCNANLPSSYMARPWSFLIKYKR